MRADGFGLSALMSTSGVLPIRSSTERVQRHGGRAPRDEPQPPATAGRIDTSAPSATGVSRPCR